MTEPDQSVSNPSLSNIIQLEELRKKIALPSSDLIELTYNEEKFNSKLDQFNKTACELIEEDKYQLAAVYLDEAEKILQYAAGCGKTIERTLITTILNNQAYLLQRTSEFQQSANYLEAIIYNINEFVESCHPFELTADINNTQSSQFTEMSAYLQRKLALALYHLRFCALTSHAKNNDAALESARKALRMLKEVCKQEHQYQKFKDKNNMGVSKRREGSSQQLDESDLLKTKNILKELSRVLQIQESELQHFPSFLAKCIRSISQYNSRVESQYTQVKTDMTQFENYSIGNLMQATPLSISLQPSHAQFMREELAAKGKLFKVIYLSMAHFTVATELRLISANKYALDEEERKLSLQFRQSKLYHLLSLTLLARYLPSKSVFFDHALTSFRNHYGIDLLEKNSDYLSQLQSDFSVIVSEKSHLSSKASSCHADDIQTGEEENKSVEIHNTDGQANQLAGMMLPKQPVVASSKAEKALQKELNTERLEHKKLKILKSKSKTAKPNTTSFSRILELNKNIPNMVPNIISKGRESKSKSKMMTSKGKETIRSRRKELKTEIDEEIRRGVYYGYPSKSRSKSKRNTLERKNSKKGIMTKSGLVFQNKKLKNQVKVEQQYGVKSAGTFGDYNKQIKIKNLKTSQASEEQNIYLHKNISPKRVVDPIKMKKLKNPARTSKGDGLSKRKSMSKQRYFI